MIRGVKNWFLSMVVASIVMLSFVLIWSYVYALYYPPIDFDTNIPGDFRPSEIFQGESPSLCRRFTVNHAADFYINRSLISTSHTNPSIMIDLGSTVVSRAEGYIYQCRIVQIPNDVPPGKYVMDVRVNYISWPFWNRSIKAPEVPLTILPI